MGADKEKQNLHPLNSGWSIWELREQQKNLSYADTLYKLCDFGTVEEFWGYWNNIPKASQVLFDGFTKKRIGDRYVESFALFKQGIVPEWEDPENKKGGEWSIRKELNGELLEECWEILVLAAIGEIIDEDDEITGVRVVHKNKKDKKEPGNIYRLEIWLRGQSRARADRIRSEFVALINDRIQGSPWTIADFQYKHH